MPSHLLTPPEDAEDAAFVEIEGQAEDITDMQNDIDHQMNQLFEEFGGDANDAEFKIHVRRAIVGKGEMEHCFSCTPAELPITDRIHNEFGPGHYEIWIYKNAKRFRKRKLNIAKPIRGYQQAPHHVATETNQPDLGGLISAMAENNRQTMEQMQSLINNRPQTPSLDLLGIMTGISTILPIIRDVLTPQNQGNDLNTFMKAAEFMKGMNGSDKESNFFDVIKSVAPSLMDMTSKIAEQQKSTPLNTRPNPVQQNPSAPNNNEIDPQFKQQVAMLVAVAHANKDPALYADLILDQVPIEHIKSFICRPDAVDFLISIDPNVQQFRSWFEQLKLEIESALTESGEPVHTSSTTDSTPSEHVIDHEANLNNEVSGQDTDNTKGNASGHT